MNEVSVKIIFEISVDLLMIYVSTKIMFVRNYLKLCRSCYFVV